MEPLFEGLTTSEIDYLKYLQKQGYYDGIEIFINFDTSSDYRFDKFISGGYITMHDNGPYDGARYITVTEKGIAAIIDFEKYSKTSRKDKVLKTSQWLAGTLIAIAGVVIAYLQLIKE